eukprot:354231-Chlamydomonas_euryale.AAC.1
MVRGRYWQGFAYITCRQPCDIVIFTSFADLAKTNPHDWWYDLAQATRTQKHLIVKVARFAAWPRGATAAQAATAAAQACCKRGHQNWLHQVAAGQTAEHHKALLDGGTIKHSTYKDRATRSDGSPIHVAARNGATWLQVRATPT